MNEAVRDQLAVPVVLAVKAAAKDPKTVLDRADAAPVARAVINELTPVVEHLTNQEPWYQSRVTWGAIISIATPVLGALGISVGWLDPDLAVAISTAAVSLVGGVLTLYGRWKARKPLGQ